MAKLLTLFSLVFALALVGCSGSDATADTKNATPGTSTASETAEKAKCSQCGAEFPKSELASHDGGLWCKACIEAHSH